MTNFQNLGPSVQWNHKFEKMLILKKTDGLAKVAWYVLALKPTTVSAESIVFFDWVSDKSKQGLASFTTYKYEDPWVLKS